MSGTSGSVAAQTTKSRLSRDSAAPGVKRQLWTLTLMAADAVHERSLPGGLTKSWRLHQQFDALSRAAFLLANMSGRF